MPPQIALIEDWLTNLGGAARVTQALAEALPSAPIYTSVYTPSVFPQWADRVRPSWLQHLPTRLRAKHQFLLPFLPSAFQRFDLSQFDIIISLSSAFSKCVRIDPTRQQHICYCHSPVRYLYHAREEYKRTYQVPHWMRPLRAALQDPLLDYLTTRDQLGASTVTHWVSNSDYVAQRIQKYYGAPATTIYPCTDTATFSDAFRTDDDGYYLSVGRFIPYKKFDLLIHAFAQLGLPLRLAGTGPELSRCQALADSLGADNIQFLGFVDDSALPALYAGARAFLFPPEEDFGLTPVEAMCTGTPVIYYDAGGARESVTPVAGIPFAQQTAAAVITAVESLQSGQITFDPNTVQQRGKMFSAQQFTNQLLDLITSMS